MNRQILFKAKRKDNGEWVEGYYIYDYCKNMHLILRNELSTCLNAGSKPNRYDWTLEPHEIDPDTLCQYTGLTDKNGRRIWENDIVRNEKGDIGVVQWFEEHAAFMIWNKTKHYVCYLAENDFSKIEIAGNIFDNADLLEVEW